MAESTEPVPQTNSLQVCVLCASDLKDKNPKLLSCLHTLCENCLNSLFQLQVQIKQKRQDGENGDKNSDGSIDNGGENCSILCPACNSNIEKASVLDNMFVSATATPIVIEEDEEEKEKEDESHICTACDENEEATSFCSECKEWLCDQCVIAHKRVRITKDHVIQSKEEAKKIDDDTNSTPQKLMFCNVHKNEQLKLFCETCDKLTCRDCQLLEHKDHKYQFLSEAISNQREILQNAVVKLKQKLGNYQQADNILTAKNQELKKKLNELCQKMRDVADSITKEINKHTDNLVQYLEKYINNKTSVISDKQRLVKEALDKMRHSVDFVENALTVGDDTSILYAKGVMMKTLRTLANNGIPFHPSILHYSIIHDHDREFFLKNAYRAGSLVIDDAKYPVVPGSKDLQQQQQAIRHSNLPQSNYGVRPPMAVGASSSFQGQSRHSIPPRIQQRFGHLPLDQQRTISKKIYDMYNQQQTDHTAASNSPYLQQVVHSNQSVDQSVRNLTSLVNGVSNPPHSMPQRNYPNYTLQQGMPSSQMLSQQKMQQQIQSGMPQQRLGMQLPTASSNNPTMHFSSNPRQAGSLNRPSAFLSEPVHTAWRTGSASTDRNAKVSPEQPTAKKWDFVDMRNRFPSAQASSPGPQAASGTQIKTPSPAGAGSGASRPERHSPSPKYVDTSSSNVKPEKQLSSCKFSSEEKTQNLAPEIVKTPPSQATAPPPPPLVHVNQVLNEANGTAQLPLEITPLPQQHKEDDPNEDYCAVCQNGGELLCCDNCPKVFHLKCHIPELKESPSEKWQCTLCLTEDSLVVKEVEKKDLTMGPGKRKAPSGLTEKELKACERILLELYTHKDSVVFHEPVSKMVPNYYKIITRPIDFSKIKSKLQRQNFNHYNTVEEFLTDCKLVFKNCFTYNAIGTPIHDQGKIVDEEFERLVQKYLPCYFDMLDDLDIRTDTPVSDASDGGPGEKKKKKRYEDDPDATVHIH